MLVQVHAVGFIWPELTWPIYQTPTGEDLTHIPGHGFSGVVKEVGPGFGGSKIGPGSEVYAFTNRVKEGAMAEYAKVNLTEVGLKPQALSLVGAASVPLSALTAWQALFDHARLLAGQKVLITGAAGGTGIFAVQLARMVGAYVVGTASAARSFAILRDFGVDEILDYKKVKFEEAVQDVDVVLDTVGGGVLEQCMNTIKRGGVLVSITDPACAERDKQLGV